jgi:hypothetical protein
MITKFTTDCSVEIAAAVVLSANQDDPALRVTGNCSITCVASFTVLKRFSACVELFDQLVTINVNIRRTVIKTLDARCTALTNIDPPRILQKNGPARDPCPLLKRALIAAAVGYVEGNCTVPGNFSTIGFDCTENCYRALTFLQFGLHDCRDDFRFLDEVFHPIARRRFRVVTHVCEEKRRMINNAIDCKTFYMKAFDAIKSNCSGLQSGTPTCTPGCKDVLRKSISIIDRCGAVFRNDSNSTGQLPPFDAPIRDFLRRARQFCLVSSRKVDIAVSDDESSVDISSEDSLSIDRPRTHLRFTCKNAIEWFSERFDKFDDTKAAKRLRFKLRKLHEFRARAGAETDADFTTSGFDPTKETTTQSIDLEDSANVEYEPVNDLASVDVYAPSGNGTPGPNNTYEYVGFRRAFRCGVRYGANRISRIIFSSIATNIRNGINDGQITVPGGVSFNLVVDNFPYRANDSSVSMEFDVDSDADDGQLVQNRQGERDPDGGLELQDNTEGQVSFNDTRKIRWKRQVFCDGNKQVIIRTRFVKSTTETPSGNFIVRWKLFVTFFISRSLRCSQLLWDPTNDVETNEEPIAQPTGTVTGPTTNPTVTTTTQKTETGSAFALFASLIMLIVALI